VNLCRKNLRLATATAELECDDPQATARVLVAIAQGSVVQRDVYGDRFDPKEFRAAAVALLSQSGGASRQKE
jgi:hypothetical protein